ncbi:hypothetical protein CLV37_111156 [Kineococcus rhizosphaerae]|uniref:Uncharacterized protein n=1 Tax=Kineococcus rhizosphaerae TaxID=559628 RepID=A0A2T0QZS3_9ACTN|nr:hypothetical protein CLV37_111156 [Kineococcus rhizosphaerae]
MGHVLEDRRPAALRGPRRGAAVAGTCLLVVAASACSHLDPGVACTTLAPPFGLVFDLSALSDVAQGPSGPRSADYCLDDVCRSVRLRLFTGPVENRTKDPSALFISDRDMTADPTAQLRLRDGADSITQTASTPVTPREVTSDVNPGCATTGRWAVVRWEAGGSLVDVTATSPLPATLHPR